jgi:hypothetical protein
MMNNIEGVSFFFFCLFVLFIRFAGQDGNNRSVSEVNRVLVDAIKAALYAGFRHIDTAEVRDK